MSYLMDSAPRGPKGLTETNKPNEKAHYESKEMRWQDSKSDDKAGYNCLGEESKKRISQRISLLIWTALTLSCVCMGQSGCHTRIF